MCCAVLTRLRELVLRWLPVTQNKALEGETIAEGESPVKAGEWWVVSGCCFLALDASIPVVTRKMVDYA